VDIDRKAKGSPGAMASTALPSGVEGRTPDPQPRRDVATWRPTTAALAVVAGVALTLALEFAVVAISGSSDEDDVIHGGALLVAELPLLALTLFAARRGARRLGPETFGLRRTAFWPAVGWTLVTYFAVAMLEGVYLVLVGGGGHRLGGSDVHSVSSALLIVLAMAYVAPVIEELAFRGYLFASLTRWRGPWPAAAVTAVLFAAAHVAAYPPQLLPLLLFFGFGACVLFWFTRSLLPSIALHALNNGIVAATVAHAAAGWLVAPALLAPVLLTLGLLAIAREPLTASPR
jgi:uncharacterized protein